MDKIGLAIDLKMPVLVQGPPGSGKTTLLEHCANQLIKIHLGDQTDAKLLLGTYVSTNQPGLFQWQDGLLTRAVLEGDWLLVEDIDMAPADVLAVFVPLLETRTLFIASRGQRLQAHENFMIFSTTTAQAESLGGNLWTRAVLEAPDQEQTEKIMKHRFPQLENVSGLLFSVFCDLKQKMIDARVSRPLSLRDLFKWCQRVSKIQKDEQHALEDAFQHGCDLFLALVPKYELRRQLVLDFGVQLGLTEHRIDFLTIGYRPQYERSGNKLVLGKCQLETSAVEKPSQFASTGPSLRLLEQIAISIENHEPLLLVGETGTGKTTTVQRLAGILGKKLVVMNMSQQSDSTDLLGGFKPIDQIQYVIPVKQTFDTLFQKTFPSKSNQAFTDTVNKAFIKKKWNHLLTGFNNAIKMANKIMKSSEPNPTKKRKLDPSLLVEWDNFAIQAKQLEQQLEQMGSNMLFSFVQGALVKAMEQGDWILLDEINLATPETLETLSSLLQDPKGSLLLLERGDTNQIKRHPDFRLFGCMNPANDAGKRDLAISLRSRFTELWVDAPDRELSDLLLIISTYLGTLVPPGPQGDQFLNSIAQFYQSAKKLSQEGRLFDGANQRQHISMRTLTRALVCTATNASTYGLVRSLYEGLYMTFMTSLNQDSFDRLMPVLADTILKDIKQPTKFVKQIPRQNNDNQVLVDCYWLEKGPIEPEESTSFILTPFVERNLNNVARACLSSLPILIQGPTSAGKTSIIEYLAKRTGHRFIRINNHEHTDLQEYLGGYISNEQGHLVFQEGILVQALKQGHWIVLDELNLAPSDVLESLNRLLDDNRELFIPETQQTVKPHKDFRLFATQNPPGLYGGRKQLSRAFRNRFLELHFTDIPQSELETILEKRCLIAPSYCKALVKVYNQLAQRRDQLKIFSGKDSFVTLRDLFRWAMRKADSYTQLGRDGYMILGEKCRMQEEREMIMQVIEKELRVKLDMDNWYLETFQSVMKTIGSTVESFNMNIVWTFAMQRLFVIVWKAVEFGEPLLLVGETGCGKTTVIQVISQLLSRKLHIVNAHQNSEVSDFVGSQRPFRQREQVQEQLKKRLHDLGQPCEDLKQIEAYLHNNPDPELTKMLRQSKALFEWHDGPLVQALVDGDLFLLDEISLADDSVLERLNSVLEPQKLLVLVEKNSAQVQEITGHANFHFFATMNPGGDYGKKELSPALRNRFTEVWVPSVSDRDDLLMIMSSRMSFETSQFWASRVLDFLEWFAQELKRPLESIASLRDILSWSDFIAKMQLSKPVSFYHGGLLVVVDGLGVNPLYGLVGDTKHLREKCVQKLLELGGSEDALPSTDGFSLGPFSIPFGQEPTKTMQFALQAQTTNMNCMRVLRALQLKKPVLLEGSPGVGKTSLIVSLSKMTRHRIVRINLSEQTDLMDLFGSDLPVEGGEAGSFEWRDGPFLEAMKSGAWVLLDELNLASQQVLEGLNACLDHRATVYVPELDREFPSHPEFRVFACQNPQHQGGGRKGLPKSFVNRFAQVYVDALQLDDLVFICQSLYPQYQDLAERMIQFNEHVREEIMVSKSFGFQGAPWEFNLRDVLRWMQLLHANNSNDPTQFFQMLYVQRMRNKEDRVHVQRLLSRWFESKYQPPTKFEMTPETFTIGNAQLKRLGSVDRLYDLEILPSKLSLLESLVHCINTRTMALLVGPPSSGKSSLIRLLSSIRGSKLVEFSMNPSIDALELLGGFEQVDLNRQFYAIVEDFELKSRQLVKELLKTSLEEAQKVYDQSLRLSKLRLEDGLQPLKDYFDFLRQYLEFDASALGHLQQLMDKGVQGQFEWMDSILIEALEKGHWIALDNCNLCSASVLDRLNSLLEFDGFLSINERGLVDGQVKTIKPHPNFRIFMLMDPRHGEVSRAMRNRSIELFVDLEWNKMDCIRIYTALGLPGDAYKLFDGIETGKAQFLFEQMVRGKQVQLKRSLATSSPDAVSGRLWITDSKQASLLIQASVLIHQLMDQDPVMVSTDTVEHVLEESLLSFLCANISERLQFLKQLEPTALEMHKPFLHQWIQSLENTTEHPDRILQARHWMLIQHQNQILQETKTLKRNQMTMAHQVCALQLSRLNKTQLVHPSLQFVFELYQAFQQLMDSHQATRSMLQWLTNMWRCLLESNMGVFLYCLETLLKISPRSNFYNTLLKMSHVLDLESLLQSNQLWKRDFVSTLHSLDLFELYQQIQSLDQQTLLIHSKTRGIATDSRLVSAILCMEDHFDGRCINSLLPGFTQGPATVGDTESNNLKAGTRRHRV
ncbi:P-loop containing nucleoside triphosphate hydrolase protein [Gorgonomyces haynaldii]|nr:P-loop containing nucleoside triphosphate hydrolase protein [Gorgonomyces haynaldii]